MATENYPLNKLQLRKTTEEDLNTLFLFQADEEAARMAAFVADNWQDKEAYIAKWKKNIANPENNNNTILIQGQIAGSISTYMMFGELQITYWIGRDFWHKGIATRALTELLLQMPERPIYGRVAFDNSGSMKVLGKCGFRQIGVEKYHSHARGMEIDEVVFKLE